MRTRRWTALVLLAAVFALHGVQCLAGSTDLHAGHAGPAGMAAHPADQPGGVVVTSGGSVPGHPAASSAAALAGAGHEGAPDGTAGHLWTVCLAVLAAGLALLLAVLAPRPARVVPRGLARARARAAAGSLPLRPPDLSALCLLRI
ncbi:DUF6153 family protein [Blastococcus sp. SYSU DS1024]